MQTIKAQWEEFKKATIPKEAGETQLQETRRAFYAGAKVLFDSFLSASENQLNDLDGAKIIEGYDNELHEFMSRIGKDGY